MHDLAPYICIFKDCNTPEITLRTSDEWIQHLQVEHAEKFWRCHECQEHVADFSEPATYLLHLEQNHPGFSSEIDLSIVAQLSVRSRHTPLVSCMFCGWRPIEPTQPVLSASQESAYQQKVRRHIAEHHLQPLALMSLPWDIEGIRAASSNISDWINEGSEEYPEEELKESVSLDMPATTNTNPDAVEFAVIKQLRGSNMPFSRTIDMWLELVSSSGPSTMDFKPAIRRDPQLPCHFLGDRQRNPQFFGRGDVLKTLEEHILPQNQPPEGSEGWSRLRSFTLCGPGGIGKTEIAAEFMFRHLGKFDAVFWMQADQTTKLREAFTQVSVELGLEIASGAKDQVVSTDRVKAWLADPHKRADSTQSDGAEMAHWLLIYDNADHLDDLQQFWPDFGQGSILITSRDPVAKSSTYNSTASIDLEPLSDDNAALMLLRLTMSKNDPEAPIPPDALAVARRLGGLPLGLVQMAGIMVRYGCSFREFLQLYERRFNDLHAQQVGFSLSQYGHNLKTVWALEQLQPESAALLNLTAFLHQDAIHENLFKDHATEVAIPHFPTTRDSYQGTMEELMRISLVYCDLDEKIFRMHSLTQDAVRGRMSTDSYATCFGSAFRLIFKAWPFPTMAQRHQVGRWSTCQSLMPHVVQLKRHYNMHVVPKKLFVADVGFAKLLTDAAW